MSSGAALISRASETLDLKTYREQHWTGSLSDYLDLVKKDPRVTRSAFERIYHMILDAGTREYIDSKKKVIHYNFFDDAQSGGTDAIYGLDIPPTRRRPRGDGTAPRRAS